MKPFITYLSERSYLKPDELFFNDEILGIAFSKTIEDVRYHYSSVSETEIKKKITSNQNELAIFLYRFGNAIYQKNNNSESLSVIHGLMKDLCACEIYYSNRIDAGFYIVHGTGTVIGSRNTIGKGFKIYQNCTIGHKKDGGKGNAIGDDVTMYAGSMIIGELRIGSRVIIGANTLVNKDIPDNKVVYGNPLNIVERNSASIEP